MIKITAQQSWTLCVAVLLAALLTGCAAQTGAASALPAAGAEEPALVESVLVSAAVTTAVTKTPDSAALFEGAWQRTEVIRQNAADLTITDETAESFVFHLTAYWGDHFGELSGSAEKQGPREAVYNVEATGLQEGGTLRFTVQDGGEPTISLCYEGAWDALDFGQNVVPDGQYVRGTPEYTSDGYPLLVCSGEETLEKIRELITSTNEEGDATAFDNLIFVMREGLPEIAEPGRYLGFTLPGREMGADLYISPAGHIYLMAYGLDDRKYVFFTTDIAYHGWLQFPEFLAVGDSVDPEEVDFEYNGFLWQPDAGLGDEGGRT